MKRALLSLLSVTLQLAAALAPASASAWSQSVASLALVNADTDQIVLTLLDGSTIDLGATGTRNLNVIAITSPAAVGSVRFGLDGNPTFRIENSPPYALAGDDDGDFASWIPTPGSHIVSATPYSGPNGSGVRGIPLEVQFTVVDVPPKPVFPGSYWPSKTPEALGLDRTKLVAFKAYVGGRGMVVRYGYKAFAWGDIAARLDFASATKPVHTHMLLNALQSGRLAGLDSPVAEFEPQLNFINSALGYKDRSITWRDLANMTSGYGLQEPLGTAFAYNDYAVALYADTLLLKVYCVTWSTADAEVLQPLLGNRIGWQDRPTYNGKMAGRIAISTRDLARFGLLYLNLGDWKGSQLLDAELVRLATQSPLSNSIPRTAAIDAEMIANQRTLGGGKDQSDHNGSYSYSWWTNGVMRDGTRYWPALPLDAYAANGNWGKRVLLVVPSLQLVVAWNDSTRVDTTAELKEAFRLLSLALL